MSSTTDVPHAATHSSLDIFQKPPMLVNFESGNVQKIWPVGGIDGPTLDFNIQSNGHVFLDMQSITLNVVLKIVKNTASKIEESDKVYLTNNSLHSLFSNCDVSLNNELVYSSNGHYGHRSYIQAETSHSRSTKDSVLACQGYSYETDPSDLKTDAFKARRTLTTLSEECELFGKLGVDFFNCDKLLIPNTEMRITLLKANPNF